LEEIEEKQGLLDNDSTVKIPPVTTGAPYGTTEHDEDACVEPDEEPYADTS